MTRSANLVASAAKRGILRAMSGSTVLAGMVLSVLEAAAAIGVDVEAIAAHAGLDREALRDADARVPIEADLRVWEALSERGVGLELGARFGPHLMGAVGHAVQHADTLGEALAALERWRAVVHVELLPALEHRRTAVGERLVLTRSPTPAFAKLREPLYAQASGTVALLRVMTGRDVSPVEVVYPIGRPPDAARHEAFFGCPVRWGEAKLEVAFDAAIGSLALPRSDARLFSYLAHRADTLSATLPSDETFAVRTRREIDALLSREPRLDTVAARLAVSERTLHRRLKEEGTTFATLLDEARRDRAFLLLDDVSRSASEIAYALGYAEPGAFFRAFKRWTGTTPQAWRAQRG